MGRRVRVATELVDDERATVPPVHSQVFVWQRTRNCPRCNFLLEDEPAFKHCRGCGRLYPIGGRIADQMRFERTRGLAEYRSEPLDTIGADRQREEARDEVVKLERMYRRWRPSR